MLQYASGLTAAELGAVPELESRSLAVDGGRLKLEWGTLRSRPAGEVNDLLWWCGDRLAGFLGLYRFGPWPIEATGMVDPAARRRGIGGVLLDAARTLCAERGSHPLLVTSRAVPGGPALARSRGGNLQHSEHALVLTDPPPAGDSDDRVGLRAAVASDAPDVADLMATAFAAPGEDVQPVTVDLAHTLVVEYDGRPVGALRATLERRAGISPAGRSDWSGADTVTGGVHGFVIVPELRGRGIDRQALVLACRRLRAAGAETVGLEVRVENEHALGLYTSVGFQPVTTEDYYAVPTRC